MAPTFHFITSYYIFDETIPVYKLVSFIIIWIGVCLYIYDSLKYYFAYGTGIINEEYDNLTIKEYNNLYPSKKIFDECTLTLNIRANQ